MDRRHVVTTDPRIEVLQTMGGTDHQNLASRLDTTRVLIRTTSAHARLAISTANLVARLVPSVEVECTDEAHVKLPVFGGGQVGACARSVVERARLVEPGPVERTVVIGAGDDEQGADFYVSASRWSLTLSNKAADPLVGTGPAVTAASALAAAEAIRRIVPELPGRRLGEDTLVWNLLNYQCAHAPTEPTPSPVDMVCFGGGSVGSSLVYALLLGDGHGDLVVVDPDKLTPRNRVRYPLWLAEPAGPKARWLETVADGSELRLVGEQCTAAAFISAYRSPIPLAVAAVDSVSARRDVTDALAYQALNAGVAALQFHVSRHEFDDGGACLYCGYLDAGPPLDEAGVYSDMSGLDISRVRVLLGGEPLSAQDVAELVKNGSLRPSEQAEFEGARLQDVARRRLYAQAEARTEQGAVAIAAPYVSALAGSILAAEAQKGPGLKTWWLNRRVDVDCSGFPTGWQTRPPQDRTGRCLCRDSFRTAAYRELWHL